MRISRNWLVTEWNFTGSGFLKFQDLPKLFLWIWATRSSECPRKIPPLNSSSSNNLDHFLTWRLSPQVKIALSETPFLQLNTCDLWVEPAWIALCDRLFSPSSVSFFLPLFLRRRRHPSFSPFLPSFLFRSSPFPPSPKRANPIRFKPSPIDRPVGGKWFFYPTKIVSPRYYFLSLFFWRFFFCGECDAHCAIFLSPKLGVCPISTYSQNRFLGKPISKDFLCRKVFLKK